MPTPSENARYAVEHDPATIAASSQERRTSRRFWRALMLSPNLETCEALLEGQQVPLSRLDDIWRQRFGIKQRPKPRIGEPRYLIATLEQAINHGLVTERESLDLFNLDLL